MAKLSPVPVDSIAEEPLLEKQTGTPAASPSKISPLSKVSPVSAAAPRKLVRPNVVGRSTARRSGTARFIPMPVREERTMASTSQPFRVETFYLRKQVQQQTMMAFVLENGEQIEGYIEWYDSNAIKVRNSGRMLIYKSSIKYMYKAGETFRI